VSALQGGEWGKGQGAKGRGARTSAPAALRGGGDTRVEVKESHGAGRDSNAVNSSVPAGHRTSETRSEAGQSGVGQ
jgi:hypothetical protein